MKTALALAALMAAGSAYATGKPPAAPTAEAGAVAGAAAGAVAGAAAGAAQEQSASAVSEGGSAAQEQSASATIDVQNPRNIRIRNTPAAMAPAVVSANPCVTGGSIGASIPGGGISLGGQRMDWECNTRATAQAFATMGLPAMGLLLLCKTDAVTHSKHGAGMTPEQCEEIISQVQTQAATKDDVESLRRQLDATVGGIK